MESKVPGSSTILEVLNPRGATEEVKEATMPPGLESMDGKTIGLFGNGKPGGDVLMTRLGEGLQRQFKDVKIIPYFPGKPDTSKGADAATLQKVASEVDAVINSNLD